MSGLPNGWTAASVGHLGHYQNGRAFSERDWEEAGRPIIRIQNLTGSGGRFNRFTGDVEERHLVRNGDLLVSWAATLGVYVWRGEEAALNQHIFKVTSHIDLGYHRYALEWALAAMRSGTHGSGMVHITKGTFDAVEVPLAPLGEQARIVDELERRLSHLDGATRGLIKAKKMLRMTRDAIRHAAVSGTLGSVDERPLSDPSLSMAIEEQRGILRAGAKARPMQLAPRPKTTAGWDARRLGELSWDWGYGSSVKCSHVNEGSVVLRIPNISSGRVVHEDLKRAPVGEDLKHLFLDAGDVLFVRTNGSRDLIGRAAVVTEPLEAAFASYLIRFRLVPDPTLVRWVSLVVAGPDARKHLTDRGSSSAGQLNLSLSDIGDLPIPLPPRGTAETIIVEAERRLSLIDAAERTIFASLAKAEQLRRALLHAAFTGRLVPQDPDDEPASVLLDRIAEARAAAGLSKSKPRKKEDVTA